MTVGPTILAGPRMGRDVDIINPANLRRDVETHVGLARQNLVVIAQPDLLELVKQAYTASGYEVKPVE